VPSVRFSRDKRGYEYVYLVHTPVKRGKPGRSRVLYWYRTPPGVRIGRKPFDEDVQRRLEQQNPDLTFDWEAIIATPMPPPDMTEMWRERRRLERAARQERRAEEAAERAQHEAAPAANPEPESDASIGDTAAVTEYAVEPAEEEAGDSPTDCEPGDPAGAAGIPAESAGGAAVPARRRRRRGGRRPPSAGGSSDPGSHTS
jgi:hypothetical protein